MAAHLLIRPAPQIRKPAGDTKQEQKAAILLKGGRKTGSLRQETNWKDRQGAFWRDARLLDLLSSQEPTR